MRKILSFIMLLPLVLMAQQAEEKKEREPVFVLPDVVITGETDIKVGAEKKELLPENYPVMPKETPIMELQFIKGPYLAEDRSAPELEGKSKNRENSGELTTYYGTSSNFFAGLTFAGNSGKAGYLLDIIKDAKVFTTPVEGYNNFSLMAEGSYTFEKLFHTSLAFAYDSEVLYRLNLNLPATEFKKKFLNTTLVARSLFSDGFTLNFSAIYDKGELVDFGGLDEKLNLKVSGDFDIYVAGIKLLTSASYRFKDDNWANTLHFLSISEKFRLGDFDVTASGRYDNYIFNFNLGAVYEADANTHLYVQYAPEVVYRDFSEIMKNDVKSFPAVSSENNWLVLRTGIKHKIVRQIPVELEIFRRDVNDYVSFDSTAFGIAAPVNIPRVSLTGFKFSEEWEFAEGFTQGLVYEFTNSSNTADASKYVTYLPAHRAEISLNYSFGGWGLLFKSEYVGERNFNQSLGNTLSPYLKLDAKISKTVNEWLTVFVKGENLLNQQYETIKDYSPAGMSIAGGITAKF